MRQCHIKQHGDEAPQDDETTCLGGVYALVSWGVLM